MKKGILWNYLQNFRFLADQLTVWICLEAEKGISRDVLKDFTFSTINDLWLNPVNRICKNVKVYNVDHSENIVSNSLQEALNSTEVIQRKSLKFYFMGFFKIKL